MYFCTKVFHEYTIMQLFRSLSDSPSINSEIEKYFLTEYPDRDVLLFYINRPAVIVGRNQSVEAEVNTSYCKVHGIEVMKRISGGGTVYHDYGNINYAFIVRKTTESVLDMDFASPILAALDALGVRASVGARKELRVDNRKISGTSSYVARHKILFHGTLLHRTNLNHLSQALKGNLFLRGRLVASVPDNVMNLSEITGINETTCDFLDRMIRVISHRYSAQSH